jgi:hypothetical protein
MACSSASSSDGDEDVGALENAGSSSLDADALAALDASSCPASPLGAEQLGKLFGGGASKLELRAKWISAVRPNNGMSTGEWSAEKYAFFQYASTTQDAVSVTAALRKDKAAEPIYLHLKSALPDTKFYDDGGSMSLIGSGGVLIPNCVTKASDGSGTCDSEYIWFQGHTARAESSPFGMKTQVNTEKGCIRFEHRESSGGKERIVVAIAKIADRL